MKIDTIHIYVPEEATPCWYPARAENLGDGLYRLIDPSPADPVLEFIQGDVVRCRVQSLSGDGGVSQDRLVAYEKFKG